ELRADRLHQRGEAQRLLDLRRGVADAELDGRIEGVRTQIPPDLAPVVDRVGPDEDLDEVLELVVARELGRDAGAREAAPDDLPVRLEAGVAREPERARGRDRSQGRQERSGPTHHLAAPLTL